MFRLVDCISLVRVSYRPSSTNSDQFKDMVLDSYIKIGGR
jgi:hypothetical protein